ncbi:MAG: bifunctional folylpolyglutamate synthase/dihydrofolate synthase [Sulfurovum sp.]|nr:bifunctional folylpolyglutamate synthase/dihydrofolate synthase [Sulfurovum sp.]MCB4780262.1 bifunctional folylpolyglutamate synthase/dihydrofolate synthase [Sulfurovum sp.]
MDLITFLDQKPLYYKEIDHERVHIAYGVLKSYIKHPRTIHIVGTNGKGSIGRMIAHLAWCQGASIEPYEKNSFCFSVGHYTSPHILKFNERIWINGTDISDEVLEYAHQRLYGILGKEMSQALSYFEYTTLLALVVFEKCDLIILEAGLGGEFDATNICDKELSVITPIGIDHQAFLGNTIVEIATTKIRSIQKKVLLAPQPYSEVVEVAKKVANDTKSTLVFAQLFEDNPIEDICKSYSCVLKQIAKQKGWPNFLIQNAMVAMQALDMLEIPYDLRDLESLRLFGRFYPVTENIRIDVGHNLLAAKVIVEAMEPKTVLIYNSLDDKDYEIILRILKPKLKRVEIIDINSQRATTKVSIEFALERIGIPYSDFNGILDKNEYYLVFGSFYTVEAFLKTIKIK